MMRLRGSMKKSKCLGKSASESQVLNFKVIIP
jgi:hypothetical protein